MSHNGGRPVCVDTELSLEDVFKIADGLCRGWESTAEQPMVGTRRRKIGTQQMSIVHGLTAHTYAVGSAALRLIDEENVLVAMPLIRAAYECALTAHWVAQSHDGAQAFVNEDLRNRRNHVKTLLASSASLQQHAVDVAAVLIDDLETTSSARNFSSICDELKPGGSDAYSHFRVMSHMSHASILVVDQYLELIDEAPGVALRFAPAEEPEARAWAFIVCCAFVWAGSAMDYMAKQRPRRSELRAVARRLGIEADLQLTDEAEARQRLGKAAKAKSTGRRAEGTQREPDPES